MRTFGSGVLALGSGLVLWSYNKRYTTEIVALGMQMLDRVGKSAEVESTEERSPTEEPVDMPDDDIPF